MAIKLVTGAPGSGKTYIAVHDAFHNFYEKTEGKEGTVYYKAKKEYVSADPENGKETVCIFTNIENYSLPCTFVENLNFLKEFVEHPETAFEKYAAKCILMIDECHTFIPRKQTPEWLVDYFKKHRKFGHTIYLITQNWTAINYEIYSIVENEIHAVRQSSSVAGFHYTLKTAGSVHGHKIIRFKKEIGLLYRSAFVTSRLNARNPYLKYIILFIVFGIGLTVYFAKKSTLFAGTKNEAKSGTEKRNTEPGIIKKKETGDNSITSYKSVNFITVYNRDGEDVLILHNQEMIPVSDLRENFHYIIKKDSNNRVKKVLIKEKKKGKGSKDENIIAKDKTNAVTKEADI